MIKNKKYIISLSGGKDSTAMLLLLLENNYPIDEIIYFDAGSWEWCEVREHINKLEKYIGRKITRVHPKVSFDDDLIRLGFPLFTRRWCSQRKGYYLRKNRKNCFWYIGFTVEEKHRIERQKMNIDIKLYPLVYDFKMTEKDCLNYCYKHGFDWCGLYELFDRLSCWCCPFQSLKELRILYRYFPKKWERLKEMQKISKIKFRKDASIFDLDRRFKQELIRKNLWKKIK